MSAFLHPRITSAPVLTTSRLLALTASFATVSASAQLADDPWTIERGRTQYEADVFYTVDDESGVKTRSLNSGTALISHGVTDRVDVQVGFDGHYHDRVRTGGALEKFEDWGDLTLRAKYNLWGNGSEWTPGDTALALLPQMTIPLKLGDSGSERVAAGLVVPFALALPAEWTLLLMTQFDAVADSADDDHVFQWTEAVVLSRSLTERISGFVEFYSVWSDESGSDWTASLNVGVYYAFTPDFCLDVGCNFGVTSAAPDYQPFVGLTYLH